MCVWAGHNLKVQAAFPQTSLRSHASRAKERITLIQSGSREGEAPLQATV